MLYSVCIIYSCLYCMCMCMCMCMYMYMFVLVDDLFSLINYSGNKLKSVSFIYSEIIRFCLLCVIHVYYLIGTWISIFIT